MKVGIAVRLSEQKYYVNQSYVTYFERLGFQVEFITLHSDLNSFDLFLLPGGYDIDPEYYQEENMASQNIEAYNDTIDFKIIEYALNQKKLLLGICRGMQSINVYFGGSLYQDIKDHQKNLHFIKIKDSFYLTNSFHHQSVHKIGNQLNVISKSLDGEVEIIQHENKKIIGVQFHPELMDTPIMNSIILNLFNEV